MSERVSAARELVTARDSSMGSSGGTTEVTIMMQCSSSLKRLRPSSCRVGWSGECEVEGGEGRGLVVDTMFRRIQSVDKGRSDINHQ